VCVRGKYKKTSITNSTGLSNLHNAMNTITQNSHKTILLSSIIFGLALLLIFVISYHSILTWMFGRYMGADSYYSHGFIIPFVTAFLIWQKRQQLKSMTSEMSWLGLIIIIFAVLLHITGTILYIFSISGFSIFFLIFGSLLFLYGKQIAKIIWFPILFLVFMFPLPLAIITAISLPMKILVAKAGVAIVSFLGIPVFREGFNITIPAGNLLVGNPCSGLRSLIAFLALGAVFAYIMDTSKIKRLVIFIIAIPVAILSNMFRVPMLILISHFWGTKAAAPESFWHDASGIFVFVAGFFMMFLVTKFLAQRSSNSSNYSEG